MCVHKKYDSCRYLLFFILMTVVILLFQIGRTTGHPCLSFAHLDPASTRMLALTSPWSFRGLSSLSTTSGDVRILFYDSLVSKARKFEV